MLDFVNTVDTVGEQALVDSILSRTISGTFADNMIYTLKKYCFKKCTSLEIVNLPNVMSMGYECFCDCTALKEVYLGLIEILTSDDSPFRKCDSLEKVDLGENLASIIGNPFSNCTNLAALIIRRTDGIPTLVSSGFSGTKIASGTGYIYVPSAIVDSYKTAENWSTYADQFRAIEDYPDICG